MDNSSRKYKDCKVTADTSSFALMSNGRLYMIDDRNGTLRQQASSSTGGDCAGYSAGQHAGRPYRGFLREVTTKKGVSFPADALLPIAREVLPQVFAAFFLGAPGFSISEYITRRSSSIARFARMTDVESSRPIS